MIYGAYLTVQPWSLDFDVKTSAISKVVVWIRVPGLSIRYYHKSTLRAIGALLGEVVKIDYMTEMLGHGKYARIAILVNLQQPLIPRIKVDGKMYGIEYEGLPHICFACGMYGHTEVKCPAKVQPAAEVVVPEQGIEAGTGVSSTTSPIQKGPSDTGGNSVAPNMEKSPIVARIVKDRDSRAGIIPPAPNGIMASKKVASGTGPSPIINSAKNGHLKITKEYRPKVDLAMKGSCSPSQPSKAACPPLVDCNVACASGTDPVSGNGVVGLIVPNKEAMDLTKPGMGVGGLSNQPVEVSSSLDPGKHVVMVLQQSRKALDELRPISTADRQNGVGRGKENRIPSNAQKRQVGNGVNLHTTTRSKMKVKQKPTGQTW
ncbi:hypothetical protein K1719_001167 [Acacia pycnantha]|nr:hypothetical protein K1719_001167 [Acacia pycnantha]